MKTTDLCGPLLRDVSRSFYLTIRILPRAVQAPIGLAYLLARASDTIADTADAPAATRLQYLDAFGEMIATGQPAGISDLQRDIKPPDAGERALIANLDRCLAALASIGESDRHEITVVMERIIRGQTLDLQRFPASDHVVALANAAELEEYTYLVAGCVGEFWTRLCLRNLPRYSDLPEAELCRLGINYGKGLQLVNILRDWAADRRAGRCYLPADELAAAPASEVFAHWQGRAAELLEDGRRYIAALRPARLRIGCFLPWYLGVETLRLFEIRTPISTEEKVKVTRATVRAALWRAPLIGISNSALRALPSYVFSRK